MFKTIKILILLAIVIAGCVAVYLYVQDKPDPDTNAGQPTLTNPNDKKEGMHLEEQYGFTSETVEP